MKKYYVLLIIALFFSISCSKNDDEDPQTNDPVLVGQDGNPRFNLIFTNPDNVDLDLYVKTPSGEVIYYGNPEADLGQLDIDCRCSSCPDGPNENIFWDDGTAQTGTYEYWVDYYSSCSTAGAESNYTVKVIKNGRVLVTKTGSLTDGSSPHWTFQQE